MIIKRNKKGNYLKNSPQTQNVGISQSEYKKNLPQENIPQHYENEYDLNPDNDDINIDQLLNNYEDELGLDTQPQMRTEILSPDDISDREDSSEMSDLDMPIIEDRKERRRGDRRRGYRRLDDKNLISRAEEEANAIKEQAAREGFEYGLASAKEELQKINESMSDFINAKEIAFNAVSSEIAFLAIKVAEKIIRTEVTCDETIVLSIVSEVLKNIGKDEAKIIIKTNPADTMLIKENIGKLFPYADKSVKIIVAEDESVDWGSCIVETNNGMIDARFSTQLQILLKAFEAEL